MFKLLLVLSIFAFAYAHPGVVVTPVAAHHTPSVIHHHGGHAVHSHVIHHPAPAAKIITPVHVVKPVIPVVPVVKPVVPLVPVHHVHPAVIAHH